MPVRSVPSSCGADVPHSMRQSVSSRAPYPSVDPAESIQFIVPPPLPSPISPMLAKRVDEMPSSAGGWSFEPKWDGFRAVIFRNGEELLLQSLDGKPLDRYFPELHDPLLRQLPTQCVADGEIVIASEGGLDFDALTLRVHPAASRVKTSAYQEWSVPSANRQTGRYARLYGNLAASFSSIPTPCPGVSPGSIVPSAKVYAWGKTSSVDAEWGMCS